jgi:hypothetical protein
MTLQTHPAGRPAPRTPPAARSTLVAAAVVAVLLCASACGGGSSDAGSSTNAGVATDRAGAAGGSASRQSVAGTGSDPLAASDVVAEGASAERPAGTRSDPQLVGPSLIKTAAVALESDTIPSVIAAVDALAVQTGGTISSEDTATNTRGVEVHTRLMLEVPVAAFDRTVDRIARLGDLVSRTKSSEDVTSQVVDVASRVGSAKDSIVQLRALFQRATKLGQVIDLERELSAREADLEALQSQQRSLAARTTMSTITVNVTRPERAATTSTETDAHRGFVTGVKQGWHGLVVFVVALSHGVGLVLPLGTVALLAALVVYLVVRRFIPRSQPHTSE